MVNPKIVVFTDLIAWQQAHSLALLIYKVTGTFPKQEIYSLVDQMRRCAVSVTSNISEGFSRKNAKEKQQFYFTALGSLTELQNQLLLSKDLNYLEEEICNRLLKQTESVHKLINGLIKSAATKLVA